MSLEDFAEDLVPGDILLFATSSPVGAVIRKLDQSPFNHCSIYVGGGELLHTTWPDEGSCIERTTLVAAAESMGISHIAVRRCASKDRDAVVGNATRYEDEGAKYSYNDLLFLTAIGELAARLGDTSQLVNENLLIPIEWQAILQIHFGIAGADSLTCSEFVQRCLPVAYRRQIQPVRPMIAATAETNSDLRCFLIQEKAANHPRTYDYRWIYPSLVRFAADRAYQAFTSDGQVTNDLVGWAIFAGLWAASDSAGVTRLDLGRLQWCLEGFGEQGALGIVAELVSPGDIGRAIQSFEPDTPVWQPATT